jgi:hypothetical protein
MREKKSQNWGEPFLRGRSFTNAEEESEKANATRERFWDSSF